MPVFGADPDAPVKEWEEPVRPMAVAPGKSVHGLATYFGYHPQMKMSMRFDNEDRLVLYRYFSRMLKKGYKETDLRSMIDRFYQSWAADSATPAYTFVSNRVQEQLQDGVAVVKDDPVLMWLLDGMPDDGPFEDSREYRKALVVSYDEALHRYPEVVADILRKDYSPQYVSTCVQALNDLIWYHESGEERPDMALFSGIPLPEELVSIRRRKLRPRQPSVAKAIAALPLVKAVA